MEPRRSSDIDLLTLAIAAVASGAAAYLTSQVWEKGTLFSAALTPVIVALVKEALARPVDRVTNLRTDTRAVEPAQTPLHPPVPERSTGRRWKVALISGVAAFLVVVAVFTVPELVAGKSIGRGGDHATTLFGGTERKSTAKKSSTTKKSKSAATATATASPKPTATETPSATPTPTATPTATPSPAAATPAPSPTPVP